MNVGEIETAMITLLNYLADKDYKIDFKNSIKARFYLAFLYML